MMAFTQPIIDVVLQSLYKEALSLAEERSKRCTREQQENSIHSRFPFSSSLPSYPLSNSSVIAFELTTQPMLGFVRSLTVVS